MIDGQIRRSSNAISPSVVADVRAQVTTGCHVVSSKVYFVVKAVFLSFRGTNCADAILGALAERPGLHGVCGFALGDHLTRVEFDKHCTVGFDLLDRH